MVDHPPADGNVVADDAKLAPLATGVAIILDYFRERYRPQFRRGNSIYTADGESVPMGVAVAVPTSVLIERLAAATDAPRFAVSTGGGVKRDSLPQFFKRWAPIAWGDLLATLPDEDAAELGTDGPAGKEFRRLVAEALHYEFALADTIGTGGATQVERRSLVDWCHKFAKPGRWRSIRSKKCWCKIRQKDGGELELAIAIRHELFAQVVSDRRLREMGAQKFADRAQRYGCGAASRSDRPGGERAVILDPAFVAGLVAGLPDDDLEPGDVAGEPSL